MINLLEYVCVATDRLENHGFLYCVMKSVIPVPKNTIYQGITNNLHNGIYADEQ